MRRRCARAPAGARQHLVVMRASIRRGAGPGSRAGRRPRRACRVRGRGHARVSIDQPERAPVEKTTPSCAERKTSLMAASTSGSRAWRACARPRCPARALRGPFRQRGDDRRDDARRALHQSFRVPPSGRSGPRAQAGFTPQRRAVPVTARMVMARAACESCRTHERRVDGNSREHLAKPMRGHRGRLTSFLRMTGEKTRIVLGRARRDIRRPLDDPAVDTRPAALVGHVAPGVLSVL